MKNAKNLEIYIQSPLGGNITPEEIRARLPRRKRKAMKTPGRPPWK